MLVIRKENNQITLLWFIMDKMDYHIYYFICQH